MSFTTCQIHFTNRSDKTIFLSNALYSQLKLSSNIPVRLVVGKKRVQAPIKTIRKTGKHIYLPMSIRNVMRVPRSGTSFITSQSGEVKLGPLVGIMTTVYSRNSSTQPFGGNTELIRSLLRIGANQAFHFAFDPRDINWEDETVIAFFMDNSGRWQRKVVSLPDVVYNRLPSRRAEKTEAMKQLKERFLRKNIPIFNWSFFEKWDVYDMLMRDAEASPHIPESHMNPSPEQIKQLLEKHHFIYLKPTSGSLGIGIYRITFHPSKGYFARYRSNGKNVLLRFSKFNSLMKLLGTARGRTRNYVAQQGIRLLELDNCPFDFRFHLNKNGNNEWVVSGIGAKKAGRGSVTTHVRTGGQVMDPERALMGLYSAEKAKSLLNEAKLTTIRLARAIERNYKYRIGELGFDIGIDVDGRIWMLEANAKPGRSIYKHPSLRSQGRDILTLIIDHCLYLAKFRRKGGE